MGRRHRRDVLRSSLRNQLSASFTGPWTQIDDPVSVFDEIQVVLDQDHGIALIDQSMDHPHQNGAVLKR